MGNANLHLPDKFFKNIMNNKIKITSTLKTISVSFLIVFYVSSCAENESNDNIKPASVSEGNEAGLKSLKVSEEDLLKSGWKLVKDAKSPFMSKNTDERFNAQKNTATFAEQRFTLTAKHLEQLGYSVNSPKSIIEKFIFKGVRPDGLKFNSGLKVDGVSYQADGDAYVLLGKPSIKLIDDNLQMPDEVYITYVENNTNEAAVLKKKYTYKQGHHISWQRTISGSLSVSASCSIEIPMAGAEVSTSVTIGGETTNGSDTSTEKTIESEVEVPVPANSKVKVAIVTKISKSSVNYSVPMSVYGNCVANFPKSVDGHYFHYFSAAGINNNGDRNNGLTNGELTSEAGKAESMSRVETKILISKPEVLKI
ncbi:hypothetical protein DBR28_15270 [Chryseobacterium sp. HMWF028]|nr:hypothetical protein DBR28_15270 [Chryseobacterium sp. HMWF028]